MKPHRSILRRAAFFAATLAFFPSLTTAAPVEQGTRPSQVVSTIAAPKPGLPMSPPKPASLPPADALMPNRAPLILADLEAIAFANNPTLAQASRRVDALHGKHLQVGLPPNPMVGYQGEEIGDDGTGGQQGMFLGQQLVTAGKLELNRAVVRHEIAQARHELEMQRLRVINAVRAL